MAQIGLPSIGVSVEALSASEAYHHFQSGSGTSKVVDIATISVPARPWDFVTDLTGPLSRVAGSWSFEKITGAPRGSGIWQDGSDNDKYTFGNVDAVLNGKVVGNPAGGAFFQGTISLIDNPYDANLDANRDGWGHFLTKHLLYLQEKKGALPFDIHFQGDLNYLVYFDENLLPVLDQSFVFVDIGGNSLNLRLDRFGTDESFLSAYLPEHFSNSNNPTQVASDLYTFSNYLTRNPADFLSKTNFESNLVLHLIEGANFDLYPYLYQFFDDFNAPTQQHLIDNVFGRGGYFTSTDSTTTVFPDQVDEVGGTLHLATALNQDPNSVAGAIEHPLDLDVFSGSVLGDVTYQVVLGANGSGEFSLSDPALRIFDATGAEYQIIDQNPDVDMVAGSFVVPYDTTLFYEVSSASQADTGTYSLITWADTGLPTLPRGGSGHANTLSVDTPRLVYSVGGFGDRTTSLSLQTDVDINELDIKVFALNGAEVAGSWYQFSPGVWNFDFDSRTGDMYLLEIEAKSPAGYGPILVDRFFAGDGFGENGHAAQFRTETFVQPLDSFNTLGASVRGHNPTASYPDMEVLQVGGRSSDVSALLKYDMAQFPGEATITKVTLSLPMLDEGSMNRDGNLTISRAVQSWDDTVTYYSVPNSTDHFAVTNKSGAHVLDIDLTPFAVGWQTGQFANHGIFIDAQSQSMEHNAFTTHLHSDPSLRPYVTYEYEMPVDAPNTTPTTGTPSQPAPQISQYTVNYDLTDLNGVDLSVRSHQPTKNYEGGTVINVGGSGSKAYALVKFDMPALPADAVIEDVQLLLWMYDEGTKNRDGQITVGRATSDWDGSTTFSTKPGTADEFVFDNSSGAHQASVDITSIYEDWYAGLVPNFGLVLRPNSTNSEQNAFHTNEAPLVDLRPEIQVTYSSGDDLFGI